jgi:hypothetical protein
VAQGADDLVVDGNRDPHQQGHEGGP